MKSYAAWIDRHAILVVIASLLVAIVGGMLASRLPLKSDLTSLLPGSEPSVRDLRQIQKRARPFGTVQIAIQSTDPAATTRASDALATRIEAFPPGAIASFSRDDGPRERYAWKHRFLFAEYDDLVAARDALKSRIDRGKVNANPLFINLDDDDEPAPDVTDRLEELEAKLAELEKKATSPPPRASPDGTLRVFYLQTTFSASEAAKAHALVGAIDRAIAETRTEVPGVTFGLTGNVVMAMYEHDSVLDGMAWSLLLTVVVCGLALVFYYRSGRLVILMLLSLAVGVVATFGVAWATVGHLNVMTAFLFAIVVGNGINASLILVARYLEELRASKLHEDAMPAAIDGALPGTLGAAATAAIAYGSLLITDFRGFREFGAIAGIGMVVTWLATFTTLPALLALLGRHRLVVPKSEPALGHLLARMLPGRRARPALWLTGIVTLVALVISIVYIARDPFTRDWRDLQSSTDAIRKTNELNAHVKKALSGRSELSGQAYQLVIAVDDRSQVAPLVASLRAQNLGRPPHLRWMQDVFSIEDTLPKRQPEKLAVLAEIRRLIDDPALQAALSDDERARLTSLRPPEDIALVRDEDVPNELAWPFIEKDGTRGKLIVVRGASRMNSFDVDDRLEFAAEARALTLPPGALLASESLVVADVIEVMERDAPWMIGVAILGSILAVMLFVGRRRHGMVTLAAGAAGVVVMIAACALVGLKVHFLDLIALPITIGIGIDYAVNVAARDREDGHRGIGHILRTTGSAVVMCSFTTAVGYATLLISANGGIRAFGLAALIGEVACVTVALVAAPAALALLDRRRREVIHGE